MLFRRVNKPSASADLKKANSLAAERRPSTTWLKSSVGRLHTLRNSPAARCTGLRKIFSASWTFMDAAPTRPIICDYARGRQRAYPGRRHVCTRRG